MERACVAEAGQEVAIRYGVQRVLDEPVEAQEPSRVGAVDGKARPGERPRAKRAPVARVEDGDKARDVAPKARRVREQVVPERDRLRPLEVRVARERAVGVAAAQAREDVVEGKGVVGRGKRGFPGPEAKVGRDLVVARARGVQTLAGLAHELHEQALHAHVHVLVRRIEGKLAALRGPVDLPEPPLDGARVRRREQPGADEHARVGEAAQHVVGKERAVEREGARELLHLARGPTGEPSGPGLLHARTREGSSPLSA